MALGSKRIFGKEPKRKNWESGGRRGPGAGEHASGKEQRNVKKDEQYLDFISA